MLKKLFILNLILAMVLCIKSVDAQWDKNYPIKGDADVTWVAESYDKGLYIAGCDFYGPWDIIIYKTDINGNVLWKRTIGKANQFPSLGGIVSTSDGGLAITGAIYKTDSTNDIFLMKLDACGEMDWCKIYALNQYSIGGPIVVLKNGDFVISSDVTIINNNIGFDDYHTWLLSTDNLGNPKWQIFKNLNPLVGRSVFADQNENILINGGLDIPYPDNPNWGFTKIGLNKVTHQGELLWSKEYSVEKHIDCQGVSCVSASDGGYMVIGAKRNIPVVDIGTFLVKFDNNGNAKLAKLIGDTTVLESPVDIAHITDSTYFVPELSGTDRLELRADCKLLTIDEHGTILKQKIYKNKGYDMTFDEVALTSDGKYIISGLSLPAGESSIHVIKLNKNMDLDTFYTHDTIKYDYRCNHKITNTTIYLSTDTVPVIIPPLLQQDTLPKPGSFLVYPNPSYGLVHIRCFAGNDNASLTMYDVIGRLIHTYNFVPGDTGHTDIDLGNVAPGCYIMELLQNGKRYVQKEIVE